MRLSAELNSSGFTVFHLAPQWRGSLLIPANRRAKIDADVGVLAQFGWFEDVSVKTLESQSNSETSADAPPRFDLEFHVLEYPLLSGVEYTGSKILSQRGIEKLLPNWLGPSRPPLIAATNGVIHGSTGFELRWTVPALGVPLRLNYSSAPESHLADARRLTVPSARPLRRPGLEHWSIVLTKAAVRVSCFALFPD